MLCFAVVVLPFSIAVANIVLAICLLISLLSGHWRQGATILWRQTHALPWFFGAYMGLMILGLLWSPDIHRGLIIIGKQWSWLLIPVWIAACQTSKGQGRMMWAVSIGLGLHLLLCVAQSQGMPLPVAAPGGSSKDDPAGLIGHISFGLLYGIWAAWLVHLGWLKANQTRYALWALALFSLMMIFVVQGRSGYLVAMMMIVVMAWQLWLKNLNARLLMAVAVVAVIAVGVIVNGPAKDRIEWTMNSLHAFSHGDLHDAEARISMWYVSWQAYLQHPLLGIGTGGFPSVSRDIIKLHPHLNIDGHTSFAVPHNIYLMELTRWGPLGLIILLLWLGQWIRMGWKVDWSQPHQLLIALSGVGLATHGLSSQAIEEYQASMYAAMFFSIGLAAWAERKP